MPLSSLQGKHPNPEVCLGHGGTLGSFRAGCLPEAMLPGSLSGWCKGCFSGWPCFTKHKDMAREAVAKLNKRQLFSVRVKHRQLLHFSIEETIKIPTGKPTLVIKKK